MIHLNIRDAANADIVAITNWISADNPDAAVRFLHGLRHSFELLQLFPNAGPKWSRPPRDLTGLRKLPVRGFENYLILYVPKKGVIEIARILHGARNIRKALRESV